VASIWIEQVDTALLKLIRSSIKVTDFSTGNKVNLSENSAIVRKPEDDYKISTYPSISVYNLYDRYNTYRSYYEPYPKIVSRDYEEKKVTMQEAKKCFDLMYQIDFWSKTQTHMNEMTLQWLDKFYPYHNLEAEDVSGERRNVMMLKKQGLGKADLLDGKERIFHSFITYNIAAEIDEQERYSQPMVTDIEIRSNEVNVLKKQ